jgi:hypothetical protein
MTATKGTSSESPPPVPDDKPERAADDRATAADHDVPNEAVIDKTLPEQPNDNSDTSNQRADRRPA